MITLSQERKKAWTDAFLSRSLKFNEAIIELSKHTDKELALVACSILEQISIDLIKSYLTNLSHREEKLLFEGSGPLSSFSSRTLLIYSFGLISKEIRKEIVELSEIRNLFAHNFDVAEFEHDKVKRKCDCLRIVTLEELTKSLTQIFSGYATNQSQGIFSISGKSAGAFVSDELGNVAIWIDHYLTDTDNPRSRFVNSVKSVFMLLGSLIVCRYHLPTPN